MDFKKFADVNLIEVLGLENVEAEKREKMLSEASDIIQQRIFFRIADELPEEKKDGLLTILNGEDKDPQILEKFLADSLPNVDAIIQEEVGRYKKELVDFVGENNQ